MRRLLPLLLAIGASCDRPPAPETDDVPTLQGKLNDPDPVVRQGAATKLAQNPALSKAAIPDLIRSLFDENAEVRYAAASTLRVVHATDRDTLQGLIRTLKDPVGKVRAAAAKALRDAAMSSVELFPVLLPLVTDENDEVRRYAAEAFHARPAEAEPFLLAALDKGDAALRKAAAGVLFPNAGGPVSGLGQGLSHSNGKLRLAAVNALCRLGREALPAVPELITALKDNHIALEAIQALGEIGPGALAAVEDLKSAAKDERLRAAAERAILRIQKVDGVIEAAGERVAVGARFRKLDGVPCLHAGTWPGFRGSERTGISSEDATLADRWPAEGPRVVWKIDMGGGYGGAAVTDGRVFVSDYDPAAKEEMLRCFSLDDGREIWRRGHQVNIVNCFGYSRCVPAVCGKYVVSIGPLCHVQCVDTETGTLKWGLDLSRDYGTEVPSWYTGQCPLIDGTIAVLAPCGTTDLMIGVDCETGRVIWKTPNPRRLKMSHTSLMPLTVQGRKMYLYLGEWGQLVGVSAEKEDRGRLLWEEKALNVQLSIPSPLPLEQGLVLVTGPYQSGSRLIQIASEGSRWSVTTRWQRDALEGLSSEQQTPIYYNKHVFGLASEGSGVRKQQLLCIDPFDNGKIKWASGKEKRFGQYEPYLLADGKLLLLDKNGNLVLVKASIDAYQELARAKVYSGYEAWAPMALVGGRLILRDTKQLICLNLAE